ncbi:SDR family oxidoreductase [Streptomyces sp. NBC_01102]|uniref:SDR family NAD(P)-dependent oxidoreductase n=1 Tax=unclassified Streptomyces TaxID=2593676 RepID=UPI003866CFBA|nr:SDR family oxidoreductase [Streptomyces sp. NBC_01102]
MTQDVDQLFGLGGKTALVTGASRGIGRAIALAYAEAGADVALLARGVDNLEAVAEEVRQRGRRALVLACDVHEPDQVEDSVRRAAEELGPLDIVVNNAGGITSAGPFLESSQEQWQREMRLNFDSVLQVCRIVGGAMTGRGRGSIINMSSIAGESGLPNFSPYAVAKAAVTALTHSLAAEWANSGVRVNAITAGWLHTDLTDVLVTDEELSGRLLDVVPMGRFGTPQDMVGLAVYLASDASRFMTGAAVVIDGGVSSFYGGSAMLRPPGNELVSTVSGSGL